MGNIDTTIKQTKLKGNQVRLNLKNLAGFFDILVQIDLAQRKPTKIENTTK